MTQSPEYPDLRWMPPASWTDANRTSVQLIVVHTTEGSEGPTPAEDGASYDQRRTDGTSTHFFHDADSTVQCVRTNDIAHAARTQGNKRGIQHELCGRAGQGGAGWADAVSQGTLRQAAKQAARDAKRWGIPVRHLTVAQVAAGEKGFCGHVDITYAFPQDGGTHTDPGTDFPWSQFLDLVRAEMEEDVALTDDDAVKVWNTDHCIPMPDWRSDKATNPDITAQFALSIAANEAHAANVAANALKGQLTSLGNSLMTAIAAIASKDTVDETALGEALAPAVSALVLAGLQDATDPISQDEVTAAVKAAFASAFGAPAA